MGGGAVRLEIFVGGTEVIGVFVVKVEDFVDFIKSDVCVENRSRARIEQEFEDRQKKDFEEMLHRESLSR